MFFADVLVGILAVLCQQLNFIITLLVFLLQDGSSFVLICHPVGRGNYMDMFVQYFGQK